MIYNVYKALFQVMCRRALYIQDQTSWSVFQSIVTKLSYLLIKQKYI